LHRRKFPKLAIRKQKNKALSNGELELGQIEVFNPPSSYDGFPPKGLNFLVPGESLSGSCH